MDAARNTLIKDDSTPDEWRDFEQHIEMLEADDLAAIADRLGCSQQGSWQDYVTEFSDQTWSDFLEAYEHCTYKRY
jgi:hypothetical protein